VAGLEAMSGAGCLGKIGYANKAEANKALARINARRKDTRHELQSYGCAKCGLWHLGRARTTQRVKAKHPDHPESYQSRKARWLALREEMTE